MLIIIIILLIPYPTKYIELINFKLFHYREEDNLKLKRKFKDLDEINKTNV